jgi:hypothetical protein
VLASFPGPTFNLVGPGARNSVCDSVVVVMGMHNIPLGKSSSQVRVLEHAVEVMIPQLASSTIVRYRFDFG